MLFCWQGPARASERISDLGHERKTRGRIGLLTTLDEIAFVGALALLVHCTGSVGTPTATPQRCCICGAIDTRYCTSGKIPDTRKHWKVGTGGKRVCILS